MSLDPSKPLPHEFEEGKLSRYNENMRQKYVATNVLNDKQQHAATGTDDDMDDGDIDAMAVDHEDKIVSQYANDSVLLNKTEFREILMNALAGNGSYHKQKFNRGHSKRRMGTEFNTPPQMSPVIDDVGVVERRPTQFHRRKKVSKSITTPELALDVQSVALDGDQDKREKRVKELGTIYENHTSSSVEEIVYPNETIIKATQLSYDMDKKATKPISLDAPEVDKLLNEGNSLFAIESVHVFIFFSCSFFRWRSDSVARRELHR